MSLFILRLMSGVFMLSFHGWPKVQRFSVMASSFPDPIGVGSYVSLCLVIFSEVICSVLLIFGVATRLASIPLIITMFVAAFIFHADDPISKIELPLMYLGLYISLFIGGGGKYTCPIPFLNKTPLARWLLNG